MRLEKLSLRNFRNIQHLEFEPSPVLNVIFGNNGQGKTSLIEGIYFLSALRSFRTHKTTDLIQFEKDASQIDARIGSREVKVPMKLKVRFQQGERKTFTNEKQVSSSRFISNLRTVVFSPESLGAIKEGPNQRRELIDQAVFQVSEVATEGQILFSRSLRQRNALLKQISEKKIPLQEGREILESIDEVYLKASTQVTRSRLEFLDKLLPSMGAILGKITGEKISLELVYESGKENWSERGEIDIFSRLSKELKALTRRVAEESLGTTLTGPHRHDVTFLFNGKDSRFYCSQGQQRALILSFKIAEIVYHRRAFDSFPLLLLDDVLSEFDENKRHFLVDFLRSNEAQTFLTTTDQTKLLQGGSVFRIEAGRLEL